jgi:hypothetical protein
MGLRMIPSVKGHEISIEISGIYLVIQCACGSELGKSIGKITVPDLLKMALAHAMESTGD